MQDFGGLSTETKVNKYPMKEISEWTLAGPTAPSSPPHIQLLANADPQEQPASNSVYSPEERTILKDHILNGTLGCPASFQRS